MIAAVIFPHQLFQNHPAIDGCDHIYLVEDPLVFGNDEEWPLKIHAQKLTLHRASMEIYAKQFGNKVSLLRDSKTTHTEKLLEGISANITEIRVCRLADHLIEKRLKSFCERRGIALTILLSPNFITPVEWSDEFFSDGKKPFMAKFYEAQRKRMNILLDADGSPTGGRWSFDEENRKKIGKKIAIPNEPRCEQHPHVAIAYQQLVDEGWEMWGCVKNFRYPITHDEAGEWLETFLEERFGDFGTYEDALTTRGSFLFHSVLTPMLNIGLLDPKYVVDRAVSFGVRNDIELNNVEGFVRQIIGWREFMLIMYEKHGTYLRNENFWGFKDPMPKAIYNWNTGILPVDQTLKHVHDNAYSHHIERLMVMGNFFMLMRIKPHDVYRWFMEMYIDAYDWVMVPNVYGMSQFSDGGMLVTKPYISGSNYIKKMSDFPNGDWQEAWDALFWTFIDDHQDFFSKQFRLKMMLSHLTKMSAEKLQHHHAVATDVRETLASGKPWGSLL